MSSTAIGDAGAGSTSRRAGSSWEGGPARRGFDLPRDPEAREPLTLVIDALRRWIEEPDDDVIGELLGAAVRGLGGNPVQVLAMVSAAAAGGRAGR